MGKEPDAVVGITGSPPTHAHVMMARIALESGFFRKVIVLPCAQTRADKQIGASSMDRWFMCCVAFKDLKKEYGTRLVVSNLIVHQKRDIVSLEQLRLLHERDPRRYYLCVGSDIITESKNHPGISNVEAKWKQGKPLWSEAYWAIFPRPGYDLPARLPVNHIVMKSTGLDISSTAVRNLIANGEPWEHLVPSEVVTYIKAHNLYPREE